MVTAIVPAGPALVYLLPLTGSPGGNRGKYREFPRTRIKEAERLLLNGKQGIGVWSQSQAIDVLSLFRALTTYAFACLQVERSKVFLIAAKLIVTTDVPHFRFIRGENRWAAGTASASKTVGFKPNGADSVARWKLDEV